MMRIVAMLTTAAAVAVGWAHADGQASGKPAERTVIVPKDTTRIKIRQEHHVRLTGRGIDGAKVEARVSGPARVVAEGKVIETFLGEPEIGRGNREFEIAPTGTGKVTVTITVQNPVGLSPPDEVYKFEVE